MFVVSFVDDLYRPAQPGSKSAGEVAEILRKMEIEIQGTVRKLHQEGKRKFHGYFALEYRDGVEVALFDDAYRISHRGSVQAYRPRSLYEGEGYSCGLGEPLDYFQKMIERRLRENGFRNFRTYALELQYYAIKHGVWGKRFVPKRLVKTLAIELSW